MITLDDIRVAHDRIRPHVRKTPVMRVDGAEYGLSHPLNLKLELLQHAGSFKPRGAFNTLLSTKVPDIGVTAASGGNHGAAVALAARTLGVKATIFVPEISPAAKVARIRAEGADLVIHGKNYDEAYALCREHMAKTGALGIHAFDADATQAGQGTVAKEWEEETPDLDTVLIAAGGGGLIAGVARWFERRVKVVGVEPATSRALQAAMEAGGPVDVPVSGLAADSLGARNVGPRVHAIAAAYVDHVALVSDEAIRAAQSAIWRKYRLITEPGGAAAYAALMSGAYRPAKDERLGVLVCGANTDLATFPV